MPAIPDHNLTFIVGTSMFPTLQYGDEVVTVENDFFTVGDIVGYKIENNSIMHRIKKIENNQIYTKGDNNLIVDPYSITKQDIIGKLTQIRRDNKLYDIKNGFPGYLIGTKCFIIKKIKLILSGLIKYIVSIKLITKILQKIVQIISINHLSLIKQSNNFFMIYLGKIYCGYYDYHKKEWVLRSRFKMFFSHKQLQNITDQIEKDFTT